LQRFWNSTPAFIRTSLEEKIFLCTRLAFSVAVHTDPDILIIDEILTVGDQSFGAKCFERILEFKRAGKTLLFVSHVPEMVRQFCDRTLWLDHSEGMFIGAPDETLRAYSGKVAVP
jgi:ABC-type polysaccharide/polyol phosphate transport system ATPase subunit